LYGLTYEPGTVLTRQRDAGRMAPVGDDAEAAMYRQAIDRLAGAGYEHYEISNFARPDQRSAHNMTYWRGEPYYAAGLGATSYVKGVRAMRERRLPSYLRLIERLGHAIVSAEELDPDARARERLAFGLRLINGIPRSAFEAAVGRDPVEVGGDTLARLQQQGLLDVDTHCVRLTGAGLIIADHVMRELI
jgi:oxygen-independent coproporphyrinogen-3 oxidase